MNILFVCGLFQREKEHEVITKSKIFPYIAANVHQWCILNGLKQQDKVQCLSAAFVGTYPREYKDWFIHASSWETEGIPVQEIGFLNLFGLRSIWRAIQIYRGIRHWHKEQGQGVILLYSMLTPFLLAGVWAKKRRRGLSLCLYVPDLPTFFINTIGRGFIYRILKRLDCWVMNRLLHRIDGFVLLTEQMNTKVNPNNKPYIVIEGIVSQSDVQSCAEKQPIKDEQCITFVYTGKTDIEFGMLELLQAFEKVKGMQYRLEILGDGNARKQLKAYMQQDPRIHWYGSVSREIALQKQREATILVNPRNAQQDFTEYSFPSKTIEYLLSGRPVVMHPLPGIPSDYAPYLTYFPSDEPDAMAQTLVHLASLSAKELDALGEKGREFVLTQKNEQMQGKRLFTLLSSLNKEALEKP